MNDAEFQFDPAGLAKPRPAGISAYMRIKNEGQFVKLAIESHLPFYDEIIAVYNDCSDNTEAILLALQQQHPGKLKVFHYLPKVFPLGEKEYERIANDDVHSMANYSNYALSKCAYSFAAKLDGDHLAIPHKFAAITKTVRKAIADGSAVRKILYQSGINLAKDDGGNIGVNETHPFVGISDHYYHPVTDKLTFVNTPVWEKLQRKREHNWQRNFLGITSFHLKYLKTNLQPPAQSKVVSFEEFCSPSCRTRLIKKSTSHNRWKIAFYQYELMRRIKYALTGKNVRIYQIRLINLPEYLDGIDFERDTLNYLET